MTTSDDRPAGVEESHPALRLLEGQMTVEAYNEAEDRSVAELMALERATLDAVGGPETIEWAEDEATFDYEHILAALTELESRQEELTRVREEFAVKARGSRTPGKQLIRILVNAFGTDSAAGTSNFSHP